MSNPYVGEIRMFAGNFAPRDWAFCNGQLLPISENETLFNLIGTTYGGDGQSTFALPDLRGRVPVHQSTNAPMATMGGVEQVTLTIPQIPNHTHAVKSVSTGTSAKSPEAALPAASGATPVYASAAPDTSLNAGAVTAAGAPAPAPHDNMQPFLCVNFIISLFGIYPTQS